MPTLRESLEEYATTHPENEWWDLLLSYSGWDEIEQVYTSKRTIYPNKKDVFKCFELCPYHKTRIVLLGQDPYINGEAMGLCFSVPKHTTIPPSLRNIFRELETDIQIKRTNTDLTDWGEQGILMLNTSLTVFSGDSNSHREIWEPFTTWLFDTIFRTWQKKLLIVMWGKDAQSHKVNNKQIDYIQSPHPSPFSANRGFFGSKPFTKMNDWMKSNYDTSISF